MTDSWLAVSGWLGHAVLVGAAVLLLGWVGVRLVSGPALRQRLAVWAVRAAVLAPVLCLLPAWLTVPSPFGSDERRVTTDEIRKETDDEPPLATPPDRRELASAELVPGWDAELTLDPVAMSDHPPTADWRQPVAAERAPEPKPVAPEPAPAPTTAPVSPASNSPLTAHRSPLSEAVPLVVSAYGLVAAALLGQMLLGHVGLMRLVRSARSAPGRVQALFDELAAGLRRRPRLLVSDRVASPVCFGLWRPTVLVPEALAKAGAEAQLRWVFAHELDHVRRGDLATGWWVGLARAAYFFVPWFWPLRRELSLAQEYLADAAAATAHGGPVDYAAFLVDLSDGPARVPRMAHAVRAGGSDLFRRVTMLLQSGAGVDQRCPRGWAALAAGGVLSAAVLLSGLGFASAQDEKPKPDKQAEEEKKVEKLKEKIKEKVQAEKEKAERVRQEAERNRERAERDRERAADQDLGALKRAIAEAAREGDVAEVRRLAERLERAMAGQRGDERPREPAKPREPNRPRNPDQPRPPQVPKPPLPPNFPGEPFERFNMPNPEQMKEAMKRAEKALQETMERLKDNPEAREQMQRALEEYRKAMEQGVRQAEEGLKHAAEARDQWRRNNPDAPFPPGFERFGEGFGEGFGPRRQGGGGRLGVGVAPVGEALAEQLDLPAGRGVVVTNVVPGSTAEKGGVKKNDVILVFAGQNVDPGRFPQAVAQAKPGEKIEVVVLRKGKKETLKGIELPDAPKRERKPGADPNFKAPKVELRFAEGKPFKVPAPGKGFEKMSVQINDDEFTIDATKGDTRYRLSGTVEGGKATPSRIRIGEESYKSLEAVPEEHQAAVKQLLGSVGGGAR